MSGLGIQPGEGILILEIQQRLLAFLVQCCELIMSDMLPEALRDESTPIQPDPGPVITDPTAWPTLATLRTEAPYRVPAHLDFQRLQAIITARFSAAKDHIWALREDPGYFASVVKDHSIHRLETLLDTHDREHPNLKKDIFWDFVLRRTIVIAYADLFAWQGIYNQVTQLVELKEKYSRKISPRKKLPDEYMEALLYFRFLLDRVVELPIENLKTIFPSCPPVRSSFQRLPQDPKTTHIKCQTKGGTTKVMYLMGVLWNKEQRALHKLPNVMDELDSNLRDSSQKNSISSLVAETISDLSVLAESIRQLSLYQPWASNPEFDTVADNEDFQARNTEFLARFQKFMMAEQDIALADLGKPSQGFFHYPVDKRRTQENVEAMRKAEQRLDAFWHHVDAGVSKKDKDLEGFGMPDIVTRGRQLERTPEWAELAEQALLNKEKQATENPYESFSRFGLEEKESAPITSEEKTKVKTRGVARPPLSDTTNVQPPTAQSDSQPILTVSKRALKVFLVLFPHAVLAARKHRRDCLVRVPQCDGLRWLQGRETIRVCLAVHAYQIGRRTQYSIS